MAQPQENPEAVAQPELKKRQRPVIAIDGPAGAGKSTLAAHLARRFGFLNLETGAMYRALALKAIENDYAFDEEAPLMDLAGHTRITLQPQLEGNRVLLDGLDVSRRIREADVTSAASKVSVHPHLRAWMVQQQRALGEAGGVVMEGRDIGTVVFPNADVKIFVVADPEVRARRRTLEAQARGEAADEAAILADILARDERDRNRAVAPLKPAKDAYLLDNSHLDIEGGVRAAIDIIEAVRAGRREV